MAVTVVNAPVTQPLVGQEVAVASLPGGPFDNVDVYISGGTSPGGPSTPALTMYFRVYATVGALRALVSEAPYNAGTSGAGALLTWPTPNGNLPGVPGQTSPTFHAGGTQYDLVVFTPNPTGTPQSNPNTIAATMAAVQNGDYAVDTNSSAPVVVPASGSIQVTTANGFSPFADISADQRGLPALNFRVFANCGGGSVEAQVAFGQSAANGNINVILREISLPVATTYRLTVEQTVGSSSTPTCTASLATYTAASGGGGGGPVALTGNANGPSNANHVEDFVTSTTDANVTIATQLHPVGRIYEGLNGLTADRTVFLNNTATAQIGDEVIVKDEDGSLAAHNIIVDSGAGNTIDGAQTYTMTAVQDGVKGSITVVKISATAWAIV